MRSTSRTIPTGFAGQIIAGAGAVLALLGPFGIGFVGAGAACLVLGVVIAAPYARIPGPYLTEWWTVLASAALVCLIGFGLAFVSSVAGGIVVTLAAITALAAACFGSPVRD